MLFVKVCLQIQGKKTQLATSVSDKQRTKCIGLECVCIILNLWSFWNFSFCLNTFPLDFAAYFTLKNTFSAAAAALSIDGCISLSLSSISGPFLCSVFSLWGVTSSPVEVAGVELWLLIVVCSLFHSPKLSKLILSSVPLCCSPSSFFLTLCFFFLSECFQLPYPTTSRTSPPSSDYITSSFISYLGSCWSDWVKFRSFSCFESIIRWIDYRIENRKPRRQLFSGPFICHFQHQLTYMSVHLCPLGGSIVPSFPGSINNNNWNRRDEAMNGSWLREHPESSHHHVDASKFELQLHLVWTKIWQIYCHKHCLYFVTFGYV